MSEGVLTHPDLQRFSSIVEESLRRQGIDPESFSSSSSPKTGTVRKSKASPTSSNRSPMASNTLSRSSVSPTTSTGALTPKRFGRSPTQGSPSSSSSGRIPSLTLSANAFGSSVSSLKGGDAQTTLRERSPRAQEISPRSLSPPKEVRYDHSPQRVYATVKGSDVHELSDVGQRWVSKHKYGWAATKNVVEIGERGDLPIQYRYGRNIDSEQKPTCPEQTVQ
eukprot:NODE_3766_length_921_cov_13.003440_g3463_i0.p1 GENE.NODE_3766_length_921_cov_13.003440_g3463_i0~~NODE_3766_length_921_cov_13.003440_g3463_i0.p1  ORF type:complete len:237 (+),score=41.94 NODE_3766_length_921_cov_13.003440_g3463_i0:47-712(+)